MTKREKRTHAIAVIAVATFAMIACIATGEYLVSLFVICTAVLLLLVLLAVDDDEEDV